MTRPHAVAAVLAVLCAAAVLAGAQGGGSLGVAPGQVTLPDAQPGETSHATIKLQNQYDTASAFTVERNGTAGQWTVPDSGASFTVAARTTKTIVLAITPPEDAGPGNHTGQVTFYRQASSTTREGVGVLLLVHVGGEERRLISWVGATVEDVQVGRSLLANVTARNDGNVRTTAQAHADVTPLAGGAVVAQGDGSLVLDPGQTGDVVIVLGSSLPIGQYLVRITSTDPVGFDETLDAKVTADGVAPDGVLRAITNPIRVPAGKPVTISAWFESTGDVPVASARFSGQVLKGDEVVASLGSDGIPVASHAHANLTAVWTPASGGAYRIVGHVEYDGFRTPDSEGRIEVGAASGISWLLVGIVVALFVVAAGLIVLVLRQRRGRTNRR